MVIVHILFFLDWKNLFHVHVGASCIAIGAMLVKPREGDIDHPVAFASKKLSKSERNYSTTECEGLAMVYVLQKYRHYLFGVHLKMFTDHFALKYLVNKPMLGGNIFQWLLLFQECDFEVIVKPGHLNARPDHLSRIERGEEPKNLEEGLLDAKLFATKFANDNFLDIIQFLSMGIATWEYTMQQKKELVVRAADFTLIVGHLYKMGADKILRRYVPEHE